MKVKRQFPAPSREKLEVTLCETHVSKRLNLASTELDKFDGYEKEKNCCADCEKKRVHLFGRPTDKEIQERMNQYISFKKSNPIHYTELVAETRSFAYARDNQDINLLDQRVWMQFADCERRGKSYWTDGDFKKLLTLLEKD